MSNEFIVKNGLIVGGNVVTSGTITINGALAATQSWVTSQAYLTSASLSGYATQSYVTSAISALIDAAPAALDTLNELAAALGDDASFSTTVTNSIAGKMALYNGVGAPDFNTNITNGIYRNQGGANAPVSGSHFTMFSAFQPDGNYGWQLAASASDSLYFRFKDANFNSWVQLATRSWVTSQNYLTSYTDTLATVTSRGASTSTPVTFNGNVTLGNNADLVFQDLSGTFPTTGKGFDWTLNNDGARIYAVQPGSDSIDLVFQLRDNATTNDRFVFWVDEWQGPAYDKYPLIISGGTEFDLKDSSLYTNSVLRLSNSGVLQNVTGNISMFTNDAGYLTSYSETDTLQSVTSRGATTTNRLEFQYSVDRYSQAWRNTSTGAYWWVTTDSDKLGLHLNGDGDKFYFGNNGDFYSTANGWLSSALAAKQNASTAINTSNIGSQSVSYANSAGEAGQVTNQTGQLLRFDNRIISPSETTAGYLQFGFTSWTNDNNAPYADYLHLRSYTDASGGNDNLVMFLKNGIGMRIYQQSWGTTAPYSSYVDVWTTGNFTQSNVNNWNTAYGWGNHASAGYLTSYSETDTLASVTGRGASTSTAVTFNGGVNLAADTGIRKAGDNWIIGYSTSLPGIAIGSGTVTDKVSISSGGTQRVWFDTNGNVGIGTASPNYKLDVNGSINIYTGNSLRWGSGDAEIINSGYNLLFKTYTGSALTEKMRITPGGSLLLGGSVTPGETAWYGTGVFGPDGNDKIILGYLGSGTNGATIGAHNSALNSWADLNITGPTIIFRNLTQTETIRITNAGNVGIGTSSPTEKLHVSGAAIFDGGSGNSSTDSVVYITKSNNSDWGLYVNASGLDYGMYARVSPSAEYALSIHNGTAWTTRITGNAIVYLGEKNAIEGNYDSWLRLNNSNHYTSGVYTPGVMRADGGFNVSGNTVWHAANDGSGSGLDADLLDGQNSTEFLRLLSGGAEASLDSYTDNGVRSVSFAGHSQHLLSWNAGGSTGTVQQLFHYGTPNNGWRIRNKTDNSSWSDWGYVVMASSNQGLISGTIATQSWVGSQSYATTSYVTTQINNLINGAPGALDTLDELAAALGDDSNFATTVTNSIAGKVSKSGDTMTGNLTLAGGTNILFTGGSHAIAGNNTGYLHFYDYTNVYFNNQLVIRGGIQNDGGNVLIDDNLNVNGELAFPDGAGAYSNIIRSAAYPSEGYPSGQNFWMEYRAKGGHHFILNTDGGVGAGLASMDDFVIWQGAIDGNRLLEVSNIGNLWIAGALTEASSFKLKENIETSEGNLEKVVNLRPVTYNKIGSQTTELGLIAEEVAEVYPEFVQYDENGEPVGVHYSRLTAALIGAVKELTNQVQELNKKING